ncbi:MAG: protoporphyrinogen oxidase [Acidimicrobiia bacterium]
MVPADELTSMSQTSARVAVVGGGLAGLFAASALIARGVDDLLVLDRAAKPGGVARTIHRDGYALEPAVGTLKLPHPHLSPILERSGVEVMRAHMGSSIRYVYTRDRLVGFPPSPKALFAPLVPLSAKLRGAIEPLVRDRTGSEEESLDSYMRRRFGDRLGGMLAWLAASGVYAGDPARLSATGSFPGLSTVGDRAGSILIGGLRHLRTRERGMPRPTSHLPVGGMSGLAESIASSLGERFRAGSEVGSVTLGPTGWIVESTGTIHAEQVVLAVPPHVAADLVDDDLAAVLAGSVSAPVVVVGVGGSSRDVPIPDGFGVLTGPDVPGVTRGILFESSYAPRRAPKGHGLAKVIAGGATSPDVAGWDDEEILEVVIEETGRVLGVGLAPTFTEIVRHIPGIPQYEVGHIAWLSGLERALAQRPGLYLTGWGYRGVGVTHLATEAATLARRVGNGG